MADTQDNGEQPVVEAKSEVGQNPSVSEPNSPSIARDSEGERVANGAEETKMDFILDIPLEITVELGRTRMVINDLLKLGQGSVIELSKIAGETLEILANQRLIAKGEAVVVNEKFGVRLTEVISPIERLERLK